MYYSANIFGGAVCISDTPSLNTMYTIKISIAGQPGYYEYEVGTNKDQALEHFGNIVRDGYRRVNERNQLVHHLPRTIDKIVLDGPDIKTDYPDSFVTT
jgi:hypothetical protein